MVKPHPNAILPLAITVQIARDVLAEAGFDPNVVTLVAHAAGDDTAQKLALRPEVKLIDFTGSSRQRRVARAQRAPGAGVHRKGGRQPDRHRFGRRHQERGAQHRVLARAVHRPDVHGAAEHLHPARRHRHRRRARCRSIRSAQALADAVQKLVADPARAVEILGAIVNDGVAAAHRGRAQRWARCCSTAARSRIRSFHRRASPRRCW